MRRGGAGMEGWFHLADNFYPQGNSNLGTGAQLYIGLSGGLKGSDGVVGSLNGASGGKTNTPSYLPVLLTPNGNRSVGAPNPNQSNGGNGGAHGHAIITGAGIDNRSSGDAGGGGGGDPGGGGAARGAAPEAVAPRLRMELGQEHGCVGARLRRGGRP